MDVGVFIIDAADTPLGHQQGVGLYLDRPQRSGGVGGEVWTTAPARKDHRPPLLQMTDRPAPDEGLGNLMHLDRPLYMGSESFLLHDILQRQGDDDGAEHA